MGAWGAWVDEQGRDGMIKLTDSLDFLPYPPPPVFSLKTKGTTYQQPPQSQDAIFVRSMADLRR